jgi:hypothetical protein
MTISKTLGYRTRFDMGTNILKRQQQINVVDSLSITAGMHQIRILARQRSIRRARNSG